jgi:AcrR family transcriptional regulator
MMSSMVAVGEPEDGAAVVAPKNRAAKPAEKRPAHRPSRRLQIIHAAIDVFARQGYVEASVEDIAKVAGVAPTAIYYHFGGKEELFNQALRVAMDAWSENLIRTRPDGASTIVGLREVVRAGWDYWKAHPAAAALIARYSEGSTVQALQLRREWEQRHLDRAYDYLDAPRNTRSSRRAREQRAAHSLTMRLMIDGILAVQAVAMDSGFSPDEVTELSVAVEELSVRLIESLR